jgi:hypothetical protein
MQRLCTEFAVPEEQCEAIRRHLEGAADVFFHWRQNVDEAPTPGECRAALTEIAELTKRLRDCLSRMDARTQTAFWFPETALASAVMQGATETPFGHKIERQTIDDTVEIVWHEDPASLLRAVTILHNYARQGLDRVPDDPGGQRQLWGLRHWIGNLHILWTGILGRKFTVDSHQGEPVSEAARFCVATTRLTAPDITNGQIFTAMQRQRRTRNRPSSPTT